MERNKNKTLSHLLHPWRGVSSSLLVFCLFGSITQTFCDGYFEKLKGTFENSILGLFEPHKLKQLEYPLWAIVAMEI